MQKWVPLFQEAYSRPQLPPLPKPLPSADASAGHVLLTPSRLPATPSTPAGNPEEPFTTPLTGLPLPHSSSCETPDLTPVHTPRPSSQHPTPFPEPRVWDSPEEAMENEVNSNRPPVPVSGGGSAGETTPLPPTPSMPSPPRCCFVLKNRDSNASSSSFTITPSSASPQTPVSFQRGPLLVMRHNQTGEEQRAGLAQQGLRSKGEGRLGSGRWDENEEQENRGPAGTADLGSVRHPGKDWLNRQQLLRGSPLY